MIKRLTLIAGAAMTFFARPSEWTRAPKDTADATPFAGGSQHYFAFLSYSHRDETTAQWLHEELEKFRVPRHLVGRITDHGAVPRRLTPIFRDLKELPASDDLGTEIKAALAASQYMVVLCSPAAAESRWTNAEIEAFKRARPEGGVFAAILSGEPFASEIPGREKEECLPQALRFKYDRRGRPTSKRAEPLAADLRGTGEARRLGFLKLVAGMLGVGLDDLVRREAVRRQQRLAVLAAASLAGMVVTSGLAITAIDARDAARDQRREAESLVGFMLGDLKSKLEPIGRLDALDGVGARVLQYYQHQDRAELSDSALTQRSRALALMAGVASSRGRLDEASRLYREAMSGTAEAVRRDPDDAQRLFDHAQNVFYIGAIALQQADPADAEVAFREYERLARRMVALAPDNLRWRMEAQNAHANLGVVMYNQRRFAEAASHFEHALSTMRGIAIADPASREYQKSLAETLAWSADAHTAVGQLDIATAEREQLVRLLDGLVRSSRGDVAYGESAVPAHRTLGELYALQGRLGLAVDQAREAANHAQELLALEGSNGAWRRQAARAKLNLADYLFRSGKTAEAAAELQSACKPTVSLARRERAAPDWVALRRDCLTTEAIFDLGSGAGARALTTGTRALAEARSVKSSDSIDDQYGVARANRLIGDASRSLGDRSAARAAWGNAFAALPRTSAERPSEMAERQLILVRVGRAAEAEQLARRLLAMGYRAGESRGG
jgi:tetratricopeptide (TPR) repeat protein